MSLCMNAQSCLTLCSPMNCNPPDSSIHGISQATILEWVSIPLLQGIFPTQGSNPHLLHFLHWEADSLPQSHLGSPLKINVMKRSKQCGIYLVGLSGKALEEIILELKFRGLGHNKGQKQYGPHRSRRY